VRDAATLFLLLAALGAGCASAPAEQPPQPDRVAPDGVKPQETPVPEPLTAKTLGPLLAKSEQRLIASRRSITAASTALEGWAALTSIGDQLGDAFKARGAELTWKRSNTRARVRTLIEEVWSPGSLSLGTSYNQCEGSTLTHHISSEALKHALASEREQTLPEFLADQTATAFRAALDQLAGADRGLDAATAPVTSSLATANATANSLNPALTAWEASEPEAREAAAAKIRGILESLDGEITAALPGIRALCAAADAHAKASLGVSEELRTLAKSLGRWIESLGEDAPPELRETWERLRPEGD
tara:strand:+ start:69 stop:980 length:912 start_codon:yes stop_codon:yes gene_type:complete